MTSLQCVKSNTKNQQHKFEQKKQNSINSP